MIALNPPWVRYAMIKCPASIFADRRKRGLVAATKPPADLLTQAQAAARLGCSIKTLNGHIATGALGYVITGHGKVRPRRMFVPADLDAFIKAQTRKDSPCPSTSRTTRRISSSTFGSNVTAFTARPNARTGKKRKR